MPPSLTDTDTVKSNTTLGNWLPLTDYTTNDAGNVRTITDLNAPGEARLYRVLIAK